MPDMPEPKTDTNKGANPAVENPAVENREAVKSHEDELLKIRQEEKEHFVQRSAKERKMPYVDITKFPINPDVLHTVAPEDSKQGKLMPFFKIGKKLRIAVSNPKNPETKNVLKKLQEAGYETELHLATEEGIFYAQHLYQSEQYKPEEKVEVDVSGEQKFYEEELRSLSALKEKIESLSAEEALAALHAGAVKTGASDIHYQPEEKACAVRFRIDGILHKVFDISKEAYAGLANQIKYKSKMKLNVSNIPQDGRYFFDVAGRKIDVRVASIPTEYGESISCRILDTGKRFETFEDLGFSGRSLKVLRNASQLSYGMVLVTGPTGSGKTTTLYALLRKFNQPGKKVITLEDPIEYHLPGVVQSQIQEKAGYDFGSGLRSILRHDPDIVMIGEIRTLDTAKAACEAALTGHVLLSTLHTNSAVKAIPRLLAIGIAPFVLAPSLHTVVAQRLLRKICDKCALEKNITAKEKKIFEDTLAVLASMKLNGHYEIPLKLKKGGGCDECNGTGYLGRLVISEVLTVDDAMRDAVLNGAPESKLFELARAQGMLTMKEDGVLKALSGITTIEEVFRVTAT